MFCGIDTVQSCLLIHLCGHPQSTLHGYLFISNRRFNIDEQGRAAWTSALMGTELTTTKSEQLREIQRQCHGFEAQR